MRQQTLADEGFETFRKPTPREQFLDEMSQIIPRRDLCKVIKPFYPKPKGAGLPPMGLERMLRIHLQVLGDLLHGEETRLWGDSAYAGQADMIREHAPARKTLPARRVAVTAR